MPAQETTQKFEEWFITRISTSLPHMEDKPESVLVKSEPRCSSLAMDFEKLNIISISFSSSQHSEFL